MISCLPDLSTKGEHGEHDDKRKGSLERHKGRNRRCCFAARTVGIIWMFIEALSAIPQANSKSALKALKGMIVIARGI
jgi:hypothetical protein